MNDDEFIPTRLSLLTRLKNLDDQESWKDFFDTYARLIYRVAAKAGLTDAEAQDVVQETFLRVARHPRKLLDVESCHNWLLKVARNIGITQLRREARARRHAGAVATRAQVAAEAAEIEKTKAVEKEEMRARVQAEIEHLGPRYRELLLLKVQEDKSYREIAEITGLTVTNVGYLLHMAMKELSRRLQRSKESLL